VVVEMTLFCNPYTEPLSHHLPLHPTGNVNGVGKDIRSYRDYQPLADHPSVVEHQRHYVRQAVEELNDLDSLCFEICNEPCTTRPAGRTETRPGCARGSRY
jgi:hypothetical protein